MQVLKSDQEIYVIQKQLVFDIISLMLVLLCIHLSIPKCW